MSGCPYEAEGGFPGGTTGKQTCLPVQETKETQVQSLGLEDPLEEGNPLQYPCRENAVDERA